ncbi:vegetative cell wall protein gp1-like [Homalodisca vitripennis]|uniref:vegetative cell wall protein gp1-like n=1 Tax=Homalodisca vitripennis TaxID=197043 RepID=UPI001EEAF014|nr:vegetative cell wall protein gp1-like [Homalodisca vitripennis]
MPYPTLSPPYQLPTRQPNNHPTPSHHNPHTLSPQTNNPPHPHPTPPAPINPPHHPTPTSLTQPQYFHPIQLPKSSYTPLSTYSTPQTHTPQIPPPPPPHSANPINKHVPNLSPKSPTTPLHHNTNHYSSSSNPSLFNLQ